MSRTMVLELNVARVEGRLRGETTEERLGGLWLVEFVTAHGCETPEQAQFLCAAVGVVDQDPGDLSCTRIVIAHRLSVIRNADQILALKDGEVIEREAHEELLRMNGHYAELLQSKPFEDQYDE